MAPPRDRLLGSFSKRSYTKSPESAPVPCEMDAALMTEAEPTIAGVYLDEAERLWRSVYAFSGDREVAGDAVAEAFAQCIRRGEAIRSPKAWVWKAAFRLAAAELKERGRWRPLPDDRAYELPEPQTDLIRALATLTLHQRAAFLLKHYAGYDARGIGDIL